MELERSCGILLHPTSLPGPWGMGDLGEAARRWVDFLAGTGQRWWQILPLGPTGYGNSPYMCFSARAGNPLLVSPELLVAEGLLPAAELEGRAPLPEGRVDYPEAIRLKRELLGDSFLHFQADGPEAHRRALADFRERNADWLEDYALFMALKEAHYQRAWSLWEPEFVRREPGAMAQVRETLAERIDFHCYAQYLFHRQWMAVRDYCHERDVRIIGDLPIYLAHDSAEVWANPEKFHLDPDGHPTHIAGVPPDYFSRTGQRWGNPLYRWELMRDNGYAWWIERLRSNRAFYDLVRLDHFRGFEAYWEVPASSPDATQGRWVKGPDADLLAALQAALGELPVIAEDLGVITPEVERLRDRFGLPGMRVLQMAFGDDPKAHDYRPHNYPRHCVVYTATHDHNTTVGWFTAQPGVETTQSAAVVAEEREFARRYAHSDGSEIHWDILRLAWGSVAALAIAPLQDVLGLGGEARMNRPGTPEGNWEWRFTEDALTDEVRERLLGLTRTYGRLRSGPP